MNRAIRFVPLFSLACAVGCFVPSIEKLSEEHPVVEYTCDARYSECPNGLLCVEGRCRDTATLACIPREERECYSNVGECRIGKKTCGQDATFGACVGGVGPVPEVCDGKDNDCDRTADNLSALALLRDNVPDSALDAAWVMGTDRALIAMAGADGIRLRSIGKNGDIIEGDTLAPTAQRRALSPVIATRDGIALVAWIEPEIPLVKDDRAQVVVVKVDKNGKQVAGQRIVVHSDHTLPYITGVKLAIGKEHLLVVLSTSSIDREPAEGDSPSRETWTTTHSLDLSIESPISHYLASPNHRFGLHATADAFGDGFVVAYEDKGIRYTVRLSHSDTEILTPWLLTRDATSHSPFVSISPGDEVNRFVFYARSNPTAFTSEIVNTRCSELSGTAGGDCGTETVLFKSTKRIRRAWVAQEDGSPGLSHALFSWQEWSAPKTSLSMARFDSANVTREKLVTSTETFGEAFYIASNQLLNAVYLQNPSPAEPATPKDAYVQPLCFF
ncbi:hypothetical protein NR798_25245 [Archangium gephyra]|uniref:hypothetical protein n=1 Tax=Archangium gephyra TaxID=48 RepID=UPI0035D401E6